MRIPVLTSAFYNESLLIILGIFLGIVVGGTAIAATLGFGSADPELIQAQATIRAGWIQGIMTLLAGCAAIAAAAIAYQGVLRQVHLSESQFNARVAAYNIKIILTTEELRKNIYTGYIEIINSKPSKNYALMKIFS